MNIIEQLNIAIDTNNLKKIEELFPEASKKVIKTSYRLFVSAMRSYNYDIILRLLQLNKIDPSFGDNHLLSFALEKGKTKIVRLLLKNDFVLKSLDSNGLIEDIVYLNNLSIFKLFIYNTNFNLDSDHVIQTVFDTRGFKLREALWNCYRFEDLKLSYLYIIAIYGEPYMLKNALIKLGKDFNFKPTIFDFVFDEIWIRKNYSNLDILWKIKDLKENLEKNDQTLFNIINQYYLEKKINCF